jgi:hypothetical protein
MAAFDAQINDFVRATQKRVRTVIAKATIAVFNDAQRLKINGGNMPLKIGVLRDSGSVYYDGKAIAQGGEQSASVATLTSGVGGGGSISARTAEPDIYFEWTAEYAVYQESINGFMRLAAARWNEQVLAASRGLEASINARRR